MDISKGDAIAHLAKWFNSSTEVRALYTTLTGTSSVTGTIIGLSPDAIKVSGMGCELNLYFRSTSTFDYRDVRGATTDANKDRTNKYPIIISVKFSNGDRVEILEYFRD